VIRSFLVFCLGQFEGEGGGLLIVQFDFAPRGCGIGSSGYRLLEGRSFGPRRISTVSGKRSIIGNADIFFSGDGSGFGFGAGIGK
jgi:hypothetical protein